MAAADEPDPAQLPFELVLKMMKVLLDSNCKQPVATLMTANHAFYSLGLPVLLCEIQYPFPQTENRWFEKSMGFLDDGLKSNKFSYIKSLMLQVVGDIPLGPLPGLLRETAPNLESLILDIAAGSSGTSAKT